MIKNDSGQVGIIVVILTTLFIIGVFYVALSGSVMSTIQTENNKILSNQTTNLYYSQEHYTSINEMFQFWIAFPIFALLLIVIYGIKKASDKTGGEL